MKWIPFNVDTCPQDIRLLFLYEGTKWDKAQLVRLSPDFCYIFENSEDVYINIEDVTHYMIIELPTT